MDHRIVVRNLLSWRHPNY